MRRVTSSHFFMYLRQLQKHSPLLTALVIIFICAQLFVILIWGIVITPFYNYGMFSEVIKVKNAYQIFEVELNGKRLRGKDFSPQKWDKILLPLQFYAGIKTSNQLYKSDIKRLLYKMRIPANDANFLLTCNYQQFENWYKDYLQDVTNQKIEAFAVSYRNYQYHSNKLQTSPTAIPLSQICR
ncbi:hypothetical protein [Segetibacter sp.]|uniref:hypothetical protein n=1 Tax=Segetibacter sp. TaxID=2231182 RepID=UPI00262DA14F|nr:hypothetical protein [Segetibacter sp.]MCW3081830.1 hypothetical protein [Segetibacter sp.]